MDVLLLREIHAALSTVKLEDIINCRNNCAELNSTELVILGMIQSAINCDDVSNSGTENREKAAANQGTYIFARPPNLPSNFSVHASSTRPGLTVWLTLPQNGLTLRTHGNMKRLPSSAFSAETVERVVKFLMNVTEDQALLLPGRVPGFKRIDVKLLPSSLTKCKLKLKTLNC